MARTKASVGAKISSGKSSKARSNAAPMTTTGATGSSDKVSRSAGGGNPVCPRETPKWQRPINTFFISKEDEQPKKDETEDTEDGLAGGSNGQVIRPINQTDPRSAIIESDDDFSEEMPPNLILDYYNVKLEKLSGDNSHKIDEYYPKGTKGKGVGKKTKGKENGESASEMENQTETDNKSEKENLSNNIEDGESISRKVNGSKSSREMESTIDESDKDSGAKDSSASEMEDKTEGDNESENEYNESSKTKGKRSDASARENHDKIGESDKDSGSKERSKREREDRIEEERVSKKIKVN